MTQLPSNSPNPGEALSTEAAEDLLRTLRQKQGNWVEWGIACAKLQKVGYNPQVIFEATGFEPIQQNQIIVAAQVYTSLEKAEASPEVRSHYAKKGSDILYELRPLTQAERATAADFILSHRLDADDAKEVAKAIKDFSRFRTLPEGFSDHPGDAIAYQCWRLARQKNDLQERSGLIAKGLRFAYSDTARKQIEQLLVDFTVVAKRPVPNLPIYRFEVDDELPRIVPVVGEMPLSAPDLRSVPLVEETGSFRIVKFAGEQAWVALPGWQVLLNAQDPVVIMCESDRLPTKTATSKEPVLVIVDRSVREWDANSYFVVDTGEQVDFQWFETAPELPLLGRIIIIVRPKKILDEESTKDVWQIDE